MRLLLAFVLLLAGTLPAAAIEHVLVRWKKTGRCEIVTSLPLWGDHWIELGVYDSRAEAERALLLGRKTRACPASRSAQRHEAPPPTAKTPPTYRPMDGGAPRP